MEYEYTIRTQGGQTVKGRREGASERAVAAFLSEQGVQVLRVTPVKTGLHGEITIGGGRVSPKQATMLARQLATLQKAGVPLLQSLFLLSRSSQPALAKVLTKLHAEVQGGTPLSVAMSEHPRVFDNFFVKLVFAGENSGNLDVVFDRIAVAKEKALSLAGKIKSAMTYPIGVLIFALGITYFLLTNIVPQFGGMLTQLGGELPALTRGLMAVSDFLVQRGWIVGLILIAIGWAWRLAWRRPALRRRMEMALLKLPILGKIRLLAPLSVFARTTQTLLSSGVNVLEALSIARDATGSLVIGDIVEQSRQLVMVGEPISAALKTSPLIDPILIAMVEVGESTGSIDEMLGKVADMYDEEVDNMVDAMSSLIEPIMIVFLGTIVGLIVAGMFLPMFAIINTLSS